MSREEIDAAIKRHAEFELLYDKPYEDKSKVRVTGPFTVESLSPHRSLAFAGSAVDEPASANGRRRADPTRATLRADDPREPAQGRHPERPAQGAARVRYASSRTRARYIQAVGDRERRRRRRSAEPRSASRSGRSTARSARASSRTPPARRSRPGTSTCCACSASPSTRSVDRSPSRRRTSTRRRGLRNVAAERALGRVPVLLVRMNADL